MGRPASESGSETSPDDDWTDSGEVAVEGDDARIPARLNAERGLLLDLGLRVNSLETSRRLEVFHGISCAP